MDDIERKLPGRIVAELVVTAQIDHRPDAVIRGGFPAGVR